MYALAIAAGVILIAVVLWDGFETILVPRSVVRRFSLSQAFHRLIWSNWAGAARLARTADGRELWLGFFGPLSLLLMLALWAACLVLGFTLLQWGIHGSIHSPENVRAFGTYLYMSGVTFFTLGFGDVFPIEPGPRLVAVIEAGIGFGFLAVVIGYLPVIYQAFARRETSISMLDARAGSPPSASELIRRHASDHGETRSADALNDLWHDWELWSAELLESHLSYPVLSYYRSQHENQSWLAGLTMILDSCALGIVGLRGARSPQAQLTFAMAVHAVVDLTATLGLDPCAMCADRLPERDLPHLRALLQAAGMPLPDGPEAGRKLAALRAMYEPYVTALADHLRIALPPWIGTDADPDEWMKASGVASLPTSA